MLNDSKTGIKVRDVMSSPVKTVLETDNVERVAELMVANDLGSIVVTDVNGNPVGVITERDMVKRVVAENRFPREVQADEVMSYPVFTTSPEEDIKDAAESMKANNVRRLVVMYKSEMIGIISSRDIVEITPALLEIISEKTRITYQQFGNYQSRSTAGYCDRCRQWAHSLNESNGNFLCEECQIELGVE